MTDQPTPTTEGAAQTQAQEYKSGREAREAGMKRYEEKYPKPVEPTFDFEMHRPQVIKLGDGNGYGNKGRIWLEVRVKSRQTVEIHICRTDEHKEIEIAPKELDVLANEIELALDDYGAAKEDSDAMKEYRAALDTWNEEVRQAGYKAELAWERAQAGKSEPDDTDDDDDFEDEEQEYDTRSSRRNRF